MGSLIVETLSKYIKQKYSDHNATSTRVQFRIPAKSYSPEIIYEFLNQIELYYSNEKNCELTIKIAKQVFDFWLINYDAKGIIDKIYANHSDWIDDVGNLTVYRNEICDINEKALLVLVGDDLIDDQSSLSHFLDCGIDSLWSEIMRNDFSDWITLLLDGRMYAGKDEVATCNLLLKNLMRYTDLVRIDKLLCSFEQYNEQTLSAAIGHFYVEIGMQYLDTKDTRNISKSTIVVKKAKSFLDGNEALENNNAVLKKIDGIISELIVHPDCDIKKLKPFLKTDKYESFDSLEEYLSVCKKIVTFSASDEERAKFIRSDAGLFILNVIGYKAQSVKTPKVKQIEGMPLPTIIHAIWMTIKAYSDMLDDGETFSISNISIEPFRFEHNYYKTDSDSPNPADSVKDFFEQHIVPIFGGIDEILADMFSSLSNIIVNETETEQWISSDSFSSCICNDPQKYYGIIALKNNRIPSLSFDVRITDSFNNKDVTCKYKLQLPRSAAFCYSKNLVRLQYDYNEEHSNCFLPIFTLGKYNEFFGMNDDESDDFFSELLTDPVRGIKVIEINNSDSNGNTEIAMLMDSLHYCYELFVRDYCLNGAYHAISSNSGLNFYKSYNALLSKLSEDKRYVKSCQTLKTKLLKAFWIIDEINASSDDISSTNKLYSACLSILHPAMVEMVSANIDFIKKQFVEVLSHSLFTGGEIASEKDWSRIEDFSTIQAPIPCILTEKMIKTQVKGKELLFKVGYPNISNEDATPLSVIIDKKVEVDAEELSDSALTRVSDESTLIHSLLREYLNSYGFASDCMKIAIFMPVNIQAIMAALISFIKNTVFSKDASGVKLFPIYPFRMEIEFYSDPEDEGRIGLWISKLNQFLYQKKLTDEEFANTDIVVGYRMIRTGSNDSDAMIKVIEPDFDADICILYESHNSAIWNKDYTRSASLVEIGKIDETNISVKFPMIEKLYPMRPISDDIKKSTVRTKLVSNRQFKTYESYLNLMFSVEKGTGVSDAVVITEEFDFEKWLSLLNWCLSHCERVIALGGEIDKDLIIHGCNSNDKVSNTTIVGFGSGVGANANLNYIVASRLFNADGFNRKLAKVFNGKFSAISEEMSQNIISQLEYDSAKMADLSLVRTLSCYDLYSHDYFGYSMIRHILVPSKETFCDVVISLDSYKHWFRGDTKFRADLLWVQAFLDKDNGKNILSLKLTVIESKLAENVEENHISKAFRQIKQTRLLLASTFDTSIKYDSRYWWMQLHRIVASNSIVDSKLEDRKHEIMEAMEHLAEGVYKIDFDQYIIAFETSVAFAKSAPRLVDLSDSSGFTVPALILYSSSVESLMSKKMDCSFRDLINSIGRSKGYDISISDAEYKDYVKKEEQERLTLISGGAGLDEESVINTDDIEYDPSFSDNQRGRREYEIDDNNSPNPQIDSLIAERADSEKEGAEQDTQSGKQELSANEELKTNHISDNGKIIIGKTKQGEVISWTYALDKNSNLINRHMLILGTSGTGKSYAIKAIIGELARRLISTLIIDYTDGFTDEGLSGIEKYVKPQYIVKAGKRLPINPFIKYEHSFDSSYDVATRVADVFKRMYPDMGDNQKSILIDIIEEGIDREGNDYSMQKLLDDLEDKSDDKKYKNTVPTLKQKIKPFCKVNPFDSKSGKQSAWDDIFFDEISEEKISIFQLIHIAQDIKLLITDFSLWDLWYYMTSFGPKEEIPHMVVLDEVQNLHIHDKKAPIFKYLTEGRKFGFGVIAASQSLTGLGGIKSEGLDALLNAGTLLVFKPKPQETNQFAKMLSDLDSSKSKDDWAICLGKLEKGECIYFSNDKTFGGRAKIIKILSLEERGL